MSARTDLVWRALSGALLLAYPRELRQAFGPEIHRTFRERLRAARSRGLLGAAVLLSREVSDSLRTGLRERLRRLHERRSRLPVGRPPHHDASPTERLRLAMDLLLQDARFALRTLRKNPGFAITGVLVLALGIGANTAIFSLVNGILLEPLPFAEPQRLIRIWETNPERGWDHAQAAAANYLDWAERSRTVPEMALHADWHNDYVLTGDDAPVTLAGNVVTGNFFDVLGVKAATGTTFQPADTWAGREATVVLSHALWKDRFAGDPGIVGRALELNGDPYRVVGVAPAGFEYPFAGTDLWAPVAWAPERRAQISFRRAHGYGVTGRLAPGAELEEALSELRGIAAQLEEEYPETNVLMGVGAGPLHEDLIGDTRTPLLVLLSAVALVLLIACANVANMQLARAASRRRELSLRGALGATRGRLLRQGLTESLLMALLGGGGGLLLGVWGTRVVVAMSPDDVPRLANVETDTRVVLFTLGVTLLASVLFGAGPAWRSARTNLHRELSAGARTSDGRRAGRFAAVLVACEVALALPLAIGAGLMARTLAELRQVDLGFAPNGVAAVQVSLPPARYPDHASAVAFYDAVLERARGLPEVRAAALSSALPFVNQRWSSDFRAQSWDPDEYGIEVRHAEVSSGFAETIGSRLLAGSDFQPGDADGRLVALVNQSLVDRHFPDRSPLGEQLCFDRAPEDCRYWFEIVGVIDDVRYGSLAGTVVPRIYAMVHQDWARSLFVVLRSDGPAEPLVAAVRRLVLDLDPAMPLNSVHLLADVVDGAAAEERLVLDLLGVFSTAGLLLAALGIYAVVSYTTGRRIREIGIRMTLGAHRRQVVAAVLGRGLVPVAIGVPVGLALSVPGSAALGGLLFGVPPTDPLTYVGVSTVLVLVAIAACWVPARRATRIDPVRALRD